MDLVIAIDSSSSMRGDFGYNWRRMILFITGLLQNMHDLQGDVNVALIRFSSFAETIVFFDSSRSLPKTVDEITERLSYVPGSTNLANAFKEVRRNFYEGNIYFVTYTFCTSPATYYKYIFMCYFNNISKYESLKCLINQLYVVCFLDDFGDIQAVETTL